MATKYKADKSIKFEEDIVVNHYIEGIHFYRDKYKSPKKELLEEGTSKYNVNFLREAKEISKGFSGLIAIELFMIAIVKKYCTTTATAGNIYHIIGAQKGTVKYMYKLQEALKTYKIKHQNVYDALKMEMEKTKERLERNIAFYDMFLEQIGLEEFANYFVSTGTTMYEYIKDFSYDYFIKYRKGYKNVEDYYAYENEAVIEELCSIAEKNGIDIQKLVVSKTEEFLEDRKERTKEINNIIREKKLMKSNAKAQVLFDNNDVIIFNALNDNNARGLITEAAYETLIRNLNIYNGVCYLIEIVKGTKLYYYKEDGTNNCTLSLLNATYFKTRKEAEVKMKELMCIDKHAMTVHKVVMPDSMGNKDSEDDIVELFIMNQNRILANNVEFPSNNEYVELNKILIKNNNTVYYINAINEKKKLVYYFNPGYSGLADINVIPRIFLNEEEATKYAESYCNELPGFDLYVCKFEYNGDFPIYDNRRVNYVEPKLDKFVKDYNVNIVDYLPIYFSGFDWYNKFKDNVNKKRGITIGISCNINVNMTSRIRFICKSTSKKNPIKEDEYIRNLFIEEIDNNDTTTLDSIISTFDDKEYKKMYKKVLFYLDDDDKLNWIWA